MLELSDHARAMACVETVLFQRRKLSREIPAVGKPPCNETALAIITSRVEGYVEQLLQIICYGRPATTQAKAPYDESYRRTDEWMGGWGVGAMWFGALIAVVVVVLLVVVVGKLS